MRFHEAGEVASACAIAALLGETSAKDAMINARKAFRAIPAASLTARDFESSTAAPELVEKTVAVPLGSCHAFLSHSWSDPAEAKHEVPLLDPVRRSSRRLSGVTLVLLPLTRVTLSLLSHTQSARCHCPDRLSKSGRRVSSSASRLHGPSAKRRFLATRRELR